jgi:hypothetical protein
MAVALAGQGRAANRCGTQYVRNRSNATLVLAVTPDFMSIFHLSRSVFAPSQGAFRDPKTGRNFVCADAVKPFGNSQKGIRNGRLTWQLPSDKYRPSDNGGKPMFGYKSVVAAVTVATMIGSSAFAADLSLVPGKPAGVNKAQLEIGNGTLIVGLGVVAVITAVAITVSNQSNNNNSGAANTFPTASTSATTP